MDVIIAIATALALAGATLIGATATGTKPELCKAMGGTYQQTKPDQCPDGKWSNLVPQPR